MHKKKKTERKIQMQNVKERIKEWMKYPNRTGRLNKSQRTEISKQFRKRNWKYMRRKEGIKEDEQNEGEENDLIM